MGSINSIFKAILICAIVAGCSKENNPIAPTTGALSGQVTDFGNSNPLAGVSIATQPATSNATTDAQGYFKLTDLNSGNYTVSAEKANYFISNINLNVPSGDTAMVDILLAVKQEGLRPGEEREFPLGDTTITMVWIPAGNFQMGSPPGELDRNGSEGPVHSVTFTDGFWMGKYEVTQSLWQAVTGSNPATGRGVGADYPVYNTSWNDIQTFAQQLGGIFRLPSESEWEYACRAETTTRFYWGDDSSYSEIENHAWYIGNSDVSTHPVGGKGSNVWGLYDMSGNVWEWCADWSHDDYTNAPADGSAWITPSGSDRILKGGSWKCPTPEYSRSARRLFRAPTLRDSYIGFRLVCGGG